MKKFLIITITIFMVTMVLSCSDSNHNEANSDAVAAEDTNPADTGSNRCKVKSDCQSGKYCDKETNECKEGDCFDNSDCSEGYLCDKARHYCYFSGCSKNSDCKEGICKRNTGKCVGCLVDADCKSGNCNSALGICLMNNCEDDKLEPNDSFSQAYTLESGIRKLRLCPSDDDYFKLHLSYQDKIRIRINTSSIKTIPLYLFSGKDLSNPMAYTLIKNSGELSIPSIQEPGYYYIKAEASDTEINYEIEVEITSQSTSCEEDIFERNDSESSAKEITSGIYNELSLCPGDVDYYSFKLNKGDRVEINVPGNNIKAEFYESGMSGKNININTKNNIDIAGSDTFFLRIYSDSQNTEKYSLEILIQSSNSCTDDGYEENDNISNNAELPLNKEINLRLCPSDDDWFSVRTYGRPTKILLTSSTNISFEIYSPNDSSEPILYSDTLDPNTEVAEFENLPDTIIIRVPSKNSLLEYKIKVVTDSELCSDDSYEPNNTISGAKRMEAGSYNSLMLCPLDEDYYLFTLNQNDRIEIETNFDSTKADIDLVLYDPLLKESAYSITSTGNEKIDYTARMSGNHILNVFAWDNGSAPYQMNVKVTKNQSCTDDRFEENDSVITATKILSDEIYGLTICPSDYDYYSVTLNKGDKLSTGVFYTESKGKLYSALISSDGKTVFATGEKQSGDIVLNITAPYSGEYILLVRGADNTVKNDYDILIDIQKNSVCIDDRYEENDSAQYAPAVAKGEISQLVLCPQDADFYRVYMFSGDLILAEVSVTDSSTADYSLTLLDASGKILDAQTGTAIRKSVISEINAAGYYYISIRNNSAARYSYKISLQVDGSGGKSGDEVITIYPFDTLNKDNPRLYELKYLRTPIGAIVESLYVSLILEHRSLGDLLITAQYSNANEEYLWNGYGGTTDKGYDDDKEDDADIELYNRSLNSAKGKSASDSLLIMIEDISSTNGTVFAIEGRLFWKLK